MSGMFPRTEIEGVSLPRMLIGINWFMGFTHQTRARSEWNKRYQTPERIAAILEVFLAAGIDALYGVVPGWDKLLEAVKLAEDRTGKKLTTVATPTLNIAETSEAMDETARILDATASTGATFCLPHQCTTDALVDRRARKIRDMDTYCRMIRQRGMIPGLSTHMPESIIYADETGLDVATYIQIYNPVGFLMQVEIDWIHNVIQHAAKPVICIKPMAAGRVQPLVGLAFAWTTLRPQDLVCVGTMTPEEAREDIEISLSLLERRAALVELQQTRSKASVQPAS